MSKLETKSVSTRYAPTSVLSRLFMALVALSISSGLIATVGGLFDSSIRIAEAYATEGTASI